MIVVFGGNGQLGRELARAATQRAMPIETLSHVEVDIANSSAVASALSRIEPTLVVNAAAYTKVDLVETNVDAAAQANELGPAVLARACADAQVPMVHISTDYVFDGTKDGAYLESDTQELASQEQVWGTYHFTAGGVTTWHGFASRIVSAQAPITGRNPRVTPITMADYPLPARRPPNSELDCRMFARVFGFSGQHWTKGVDMTTTALVTSSQRTARVS